MAVHLLEHRQRVEGVLSLLAQPFEALIATLILRLPMGDDMVDCQGGRADQCKEHDINQIV